MKTKERINEYIIDCTGDACVGDDVRFERAVFTGRYPNSAFSHMETIEGCILKDSYGEKKQQHTFTIQIAEGEKMRIKGRNLYRNGCFRKPWADEEKRVNVLRDKHDRGDAARKAAIQRKEQSYQEVDVDPWPFEHI